MSLRKIQGGYALRPRDALIDKYLATAGMVDAAPVVTPAVNERAASQARSSPTRRQVATSGTCAGSSRPIAQERVDILWVAKENAKTISVPNINDLTRCKRVAIYLKATRGCEANLVPQQDADGLLHVEVDSDWGASHDRR